MLGSGVRNCLGRLLAELELVMTARGLFGLFGMKLEGEVDMKYTGLKRHGSRVGFKLGRGGVSTMKELLYS